MSTVTTSPEDEQPEDKTEENEPEQESQAMREAREILTQKLGKFANRGIVQDPRIQYPE